MPGAQPHPVDADWWPSALSQTNFDAMFAGNEVQLGRMEFADAGYHLTVVGMLLDDDDLETATATSGRFDQTFRVAEPDWSSRDDGAPFEPWSGFYLQGNDQIETLVTVLSRSQWDYVFPNPEFLTTYGLMPESAGTDAGIVYMYPTEPRSRVVRVGPASRRHGWEDGSTGVSYVSAHRDFVQDYCTLRQKHLVVAYFLHVYEPITPPTETFLGDERGWKSVSRPGRHVELYRLAHGDRDEAKVEIWGIHGPVVSPGDRPITNDAWDYSDFEWPAGTGAFEGGFVENVYVRDTVLDRYLEDAEQYEINPVLGSVGLGHQWSVVTHGRRGRDVIEVDLKRLNEGVSRSVAEHWNRHAVPVAGRDTWGDSNIASRTAAALAAVGRLGRALGQLTDDVSVENVIPSEIIDADSSGGQWPPSMLAAAAPAPLNMPERRFLERAQVLYDTSIAQIGQRSIRRILTIVMPDVAALPHVKQMRSIALLGLLDELARSAHDAGLSLPADAAAALDRLGWPDSLREGTRVGLDMAPLRLLNDIRVEHAHSGADAADLATLGAEPRRDVVTWGEVLDRLYDSVTESLNAIAQLLEDVL